MINNVVVLLRPPALLADNLEMVFNQINTTKISSTMSRSRRKKNICKEGVTVELAHPNFSQWPFEPP